MQLVEPVFATPALISSFISALRIPRAYSLHDNDPPFVKNQVGEAQNPIHVILGETLETLREDAGMDTLTKLTKGVHFTVISTIKRVFCAPLAHFASATLLYKIRAFRAKCITTEFTSRPSLQVHAILTLTPVLL